MRDLMHTIGVTQVIAPAVLAATTTSAAIDLLGFTKAAVVITNGAIASAGNFTAKLQESDTTTSGDFTDVAAANLHGAFSSVLAENTVEKIGYGGNKRYLRVVVTKNSGTSIASGVVLIKSGAAQRPVA